MHQRTLMRKMFSERSQIPKFVENYFTSKSVEFYSKGIKELQCGNKSLQIKVNVSLFFEE